MPIVIVRRFLILTSVAMVILSTNTRVLMANPPEIESSAIDELLALGRERLSTIEDYTFTFDHEGFYYFCSLIRRAPLLLKDSICHDDPVSWQFLLERPRDYRGREVCVSGVLLETKDPFEIPALPELGTLYQIEVGQPGTNAVATIVLMEKPPTARRRVSVELAAYFIKARSFRTANGGEGMGPLLVGRSFHVAGNPPMTGQRNRRDAGSANTTTVLVFLGGGTLIMAFGFAWLRRWLAIDSRSEFTVTGAVERSDQIAGTDEDFEWLDRDGPDR